MRLSSRVNDAVGCPARSRSPPSALEVQQSYPGVDVLGMDRAGSERGDLLDVDAALSAGDHDDPLRIAVHHQRQVELPLDPRGTFDQHAADPLALGPVWR